MKLRNYQVKVIEDTLQAFKNKNRQLIVLPTGAGKTVVFAHIIERLKRKALIIAHTRELITQAKSTLHPIVKSCKYDISTIQKVCCGKNLDRIAEENYGLLIIDECHRSGARTYKKLIDRLKDSLVLGVTATPFRNDGQKIQELFSRPICSFTIMDMIEDKFLCDFVGYRVKTNSSLKGISLNGGEFDTSKLASIINVQNRNELIVREFTKICPKDKTLCFTANISHAEELAKEFTENGYRCQAIHGKLTPKVRNQYLTDFKLGRIQILINCQILTEGFDEPSIECLLMARPTVSKTLYIQMIGRGARIFPGKKHCKVIEFTDNDYDVCSIEEIIDSPDKKYKILHGEKLSDFFKRLKKELLESTDHTVVEEMHLIPKSIFEKSATEWQRSYLMKQKIKFSEPLSEYTANCLISGIDYGKH